MNCSALEAHNAYVREGHRAYRVRTDLRTKAQAGRKGERCHSFERAPRSCRTTRDPHNVREARAWPLEIRPFARARKLMCSGASPPNHEPHEAEGARRIHRPHMRWARGGYQHGRRCVGCALAPIAPDLLERSDARPTVVTDGRFVVTRGLVSRSTRRRAVRRVETRMLPTALAPRRSGPLPPTPSLPPQTGVTALSSSRRCSVPKRFRRTSPRARLPRARARRSPAARGTSAERGRAIAWTTISCTCPSVGSAAIEAPPVSDVSPGEFAITSLSSRERAMGGDDRSDRAAAWSRTRHGA